jgi:hypothetical protein
MAAFQRDWIVRLTAALMRPAWPDGRVWGAAWSVLVWVQDRRALAAMRRD